MATPVSPSNQTVAFIRSLVRELTASPGENQLSTAYIDQTLNNFYTSDFPYAIKLDQMRDVYEFFTVPYKDRYPLDVNFDQGVRDPVYVDGIIGSFLKDRREFFNVWPKWPTLFNQFGASSATGGISGVTKAANGVVTTSSANTLVTGNTVYITNVQGMTQLNGNSYTITVLTSTTFELNVDTSTFTTYTVGGTWYLTPVQFNFTVPGPFLSQEVVIGGIDIQGNPITINDDGNGNLQTQTPNPVVSVPVQTTNPAVPGMYNLNTGNPGLYNVANVGTVNYVTGVIAFSNPLPLQSGTTLTVWVAQYQPGRPYSLLFWNNEFHIRPIPKLVHKITVETYLSPVQFMLSTDSPILNQWAQYLAYGTSLEILRRRQDMDGVANLIEGFKRQEGLVLERQATEEINQRNATIFSSSTPNQQGGFGFNQGGWYI